MVVISSGFETLIRPVLEREGVGDLEVIAHDAIFTLEGTTVRFRENPICERCGEPCKRPLVARLAPRDAVAYVGDGWSDRCASQDAAVRFARAGLARFLDSEGVAYTAFDDFDLVSAELSARVSQR